MAQLQYKVRYGSTPQGKARVYFACHDQDHSGHFQEVTDEILKICDCAIYYYEPGEVDQDEDFFLNLRDMNLFVIPVTTRLLHMPNRAMDVDYAYAQAQHIPVLPLMWEKGLEQAYRKKFGDLQFLERRNDDPTAIPYEEKLKKYLDSILIGDELAQKIRDAFDAYVFLSYRKKDRKYAQELMRLMHKDPACRDIAVWYDEFLVPGEDFNDAIQQAMKKSKLFVLTVTPNLVNETNYVMTTEYPHAQNTGKPVLPAEMVKTNADSLRSLYPGIPELVDPSDDKALTDGILNALKYFALRKNDKDSRHNFFIGLAYLSGIDVEIDHARAVELITSAAEAGLTEAMEKLVSMYENGEGVQRNYHEAIIWRQRLTEQARIRYEKSDSDEDYRLYCDCLFALSDALDGIEDMERAIPLLCETVFPLLKDRSERFESEDSLHHASVFWRKLTECQRKTGQLSMALAVAERNFVVCKKMEEIGAKEAKRDLLLCVNSIGRLLKEMGESEKALEYYLVGRSISEALASDGKRQSYEALAWTDIRIGDIYESRGDLELAEDCVCRAMSIFEKFASLTDRIAKRNLTVAYSRMGDIQLKKGNLENARVWYSKDLHISEELAQSGTYMALHDLSVSYYNMVELSIQEHDYEMAREWCGKDLLISAELAKCNSNLSLSNWGRTLGQAALLCMDVEMAADAVEVYRSLVQDCPEVPGYKAGLQKAEITLKEIRNFRAAMHSQTGPSTQ